MVSEHPFACQECDYSTLRKSNLTQHVKTVHERIKDFACDRYTQIILFFKSILILLCEIEFCRCEYRSARRSNVVYHIKTVHENIKDFLCQFCNFKSARKYNVLQHTERVHKAEARNSAQADKFVQIQTRQPMPEAQNIG